MSTVDIQAADATQVFASELGWVAISFRGELVVELAFGRSGPRDALAALRFDHAEPAQIGRARERIVKRLQAYARGENDDLLDVPLDLADYTDFQRNVVHYCRRIPRGQTLTYGELAEKAGAPRAARAVGNVMRANRFPLIVPCHRVVAAGGLGGYSAPDGLQKKRRLLALEGAL